MHLTQKEHNPPHIHAIYGEYEATFVVADGSLLKGEFPSKGTALVQEFISLHREELANMWDQDNCCDSVATFSLSGNC